MTIAVDLGRKATKTKKKKKTQKKKHTYLNIFFSQKSLGCLMDYSLYCLGHLTKMYMVKTKFVPLKAVVDLFLHY